MPAKKQKHGRINIDRERCKGCYLCVNFCPDNLIGIANQLNQQGYYPAEFKESETSDGGGCSACAICATICPDVSIEVYRD